MTTTVQDRGSRASNMLPCPHCGEPLRVQYGLRSYPFRCPKCRQYSAFPRESRITSVLVALAIYVPAVLLTKILALDKASTFLGIGAYAAVLVGSILIGARVVVRSSRATATHLAKVRRPFLVP